MSIVAALIDSREPEWVQKLTFGASMTSVTALAHGDLMVTTDDSTLLAVERKTASDLLGSIKDGRLWPQLVGMRKQTPWSYLVITGQLACSADGNTITDRGITGWKWVSVQGALLQAQELGVFVTYAADDGEYERAVQRLSGRSHDAALTIKPVKQPSILSDAERVLAAFPGIGPEKVGAILDYTGQPCWAISFLTDPNCHGHIPGVGPKTKQRIREALGLRDDEELSVIVRDTGMPKEKEEIISE